MSAKAKQILAANLASIQKSMDLDDVRFALQLGISRAELSHIRNLKTDIKLSTIEKIASALGMEPWELLKPQS